MAVWFVWGGGSRGGLVGGGGCLSLLFVVFVWFLFGFCFVLFELGKGVSCGCDGLEGLKRCWRGSGKGGRRWRGVGGAKEAEVERR